MDGSNPGNRPPGSILVPGKGLPSTGRKTRLLFLISDSYFWSARRDNHQAPAPAAAAEATAEGDAR